MSVTPIKPLDKLPEMHQLRLTIFVSRNVVSYQKFECEEGSDDYELIVRGQAAGDDRTLEECAVELARAWARQAVANQQAWKDQMRIDPKESTE